MRVAALILALWLAACSPGAERAGDAPEAYASPAASQTTPAPPPRSAPTPVAKRIDCDDGADGGFDNAKTCYYAACEQGDAEACGMAESFNGNLSPAGQTSRLEGMTYRDARAMILDLGWLPADGPCGGGGIGKTTCADFPEIGNCSGTGAGYCDMTFRRKDRCLTVVTTGGPPDRSGPDDTAVDGVRFFEGPCTKDPNAG